MYAKSKSPWFLAVICRFLAVICGSLSVSVGSWRLYVGSWRSSAVPGGYLVLLSCSGQLKTIPQFHNFSDSTDSYQCAHIKSHCATSTVLAFLGGGQVWTPIFYLKSFDMASVLVLVERASKMFMLYRSRKRISSPWKGGFGSSLRRGLGPRKKKQVRFGRLRPSPLGFQSPDNCSKATTGS